MSKSASIVLCLLVMTISLTAQDAISLVQDRMKNKMIKWSGTSIGFDLANGEEVIYIDDSAIITGPAGHPNRLIATFAFSPKILNVSLQLELNTVKVVILADFGSEPNSIKYFPIPEWLMSLNKIVTLVLSNAELNNIGFCEDLSLTHLDIRRVHYVDKPSVLRTIGNLKGLKIIVHDESLSAEDLSTIKENLPDVKFASKASKPKAN